MAQIEAMMLKRGRWILKQKAYFEQFLPRTPERQYVSGETHLYLGKRYRLKSSDMHHNEVKLKGSYFLFDRNKSDPDSIKKMMTRWYQEKAQQQFAARLKLVMKRFEGFDMPKLEIRNLRSKWGQMSHAGVLTLNLSLIRAPFECIDYVITHELCHLKFMNHGPEFWRELSRVMPSWSKIKQKLEVFLS